MADVEQTVVFSLDSQRYGIPLSVVERVVRMVEITRLPAAADSVLGVINVQGEIMPVLNLRLLFGLPQRPVELGDQLLITRFAKRSCALVVDAVSEVHTCRLRDLMEANGNLPDLPFLAGAEKLPDGMILINAPEKLFTTLDLSTVSRTVRRKPS